ncbi:MAG: beta-lactamase family protein [Betaproteobacteria bacterium]|nr:beta-lactamase family protein [Betaproteobacteria bacterium]
MSVYYAEVIIIKRLRTLLGLTWVFAAAAAGAEPDTQALCKDRGYPIGQAGMPNNWFMNECVRVGSFTHQAEIPGIFNGRSNEMQPAVEPMVLKKAESETDYRWSMDGKRLSIDDYMKRQRVMALLIVKDGVIQVERYQYDRKATHRFLSNSMAKTITAMAVGIALKEGHIRSLDDRAEVYAPALAGTLYGQTSLRHLLRMASGAKFEERYDGKDDLARYGAATRQGSAADGAKVITERRHPAGEVFNYASAETDMLALVLRGATGQTLSAYLQSRLWQPLGAETSSLWRADSTGLERAGGNFNATARDYARLGILLAYDGQRPDRPDLGEIVPTAYLIEATDSKQHPPAFAPTKATPYFGYGYQTWTFPGQQRRFALLGVYGQAIFVDPAHKLVMVHLAANATATAGQTSMGRERDLLWRGVVGHHGPW